jgi:DNA-binding IclR family transcriptional regulator
MSDTARARAQVSSADDAKRQARLREERLASERDEARQQAEELQDQLKEVRGGWAHLGLRGDY